MTKVTHTNLVDKLLKLEAELGGTIFASSYAADKFFCLDENTWIWQRSIGNKSMTTKYLVQTNRIIKSINGGGYVGVTSTEAKNLLNAAQQYKKLVETKIYRPILEKY